ncbi:cold-shock protein [Auritidibacter ignavus]|uniref:cold-shock protein n=1 Tax=Auritidibacter ignavus TaxID=678932 RepID=UPI00244B3E8E|nr:cold-shock protein [Auritidibacter ignavus]WGH83596.1 cold-shock protein [Auritidibacter ignavus]
MPQGTVRWFNAEKGYGFITSDQNDDVFVHYTFIDHEGFKKLLEGQRVEFDLEPSDRGLQARQVRALSGMP